jgi:ubiquitin carboxyl-terminal hydrolase 7
MTNFDIPLAQNAEPNPAAPRLYKQLRTATMKDVAEAIAQDLGLEPARVRLWVMVNRQNKTIRPDQPIMDLRPTLEDTWSRASSVHRDESLRVWVEVAEEVTESGDVMWPTYQGQSPNGVIVKNDLILLFLKYFDVESQTLSGLGHTYVSKEKKVDDLIPIILRKLGIGEKLPSDEKMLLWEVSKAQAAGGFSL